MESEPLTRMRAAVNLWNQHEYEALLEYMHPDVVWRVPPVFPDMERVYEGRDGVRRFFQEFVDPWDEISLRIERVIDEGEGQLLVEVRFLARGREGIEVDVLFPQLYRFDEETLVTEFIGFTDEAAARREAGLDDG